MTARVAIVPWGDAIEDFLDSVGLTLDQFRDEMTGGWLFGYVEALRAAGIDAAIVCVSRDARAPAQWRHKPSGAPLIILPLPRAYRLLRRLVRDPYAADLSGAAHGGGRLELVGAALAHQLLGYLATPVRALAAVLREGAFSALLCQEYEYQRFDVCAVAHRLLGVPVYATFQGGDAPRTRLERIVRPRAMKAGAGYIVGSDAECARIRSAYGIEDARIVRALNPLDVAVWEHGDRARARQELGIDDETVVIAWHGRVDLHRKGLDVLLHAWALLRERTDMPALRLLMIGSGADSAEFRRRLKQLGGGDVSWFDEYVLDKRRLADLLSAGDVYAFPSRHEGFPVAPLEAMAVGLPVVAADAPGVAEIFVDGERSGGIVVPRSDGVPLAEALAELAGDGPRRARLARSARSRVEEAFSLPAVGSALRRMLVDAA